MLGQLAAEENDILASLFERRAAGLYHNTAVVLDTDRPRSSASYRKMHIPDDPLYYEKVLLHARRPRLPGVATEHASVGTLVCWDQWYPEAARLTALQGAEILFYPTAIGWHPAEKDEFGPAQADAWHTMQRAHAISNGVFVMAVNRVGHEAPAGGAGIEFWGQSFLCDPAGQIIAKASVHDEEILLADVDFARVELQRTHWPFLRDRRIDAYGDMTRRLID